MRGIQRIFDRYFYGGIRQERPRLLVWVFLLIFAADVCAEMLPHGWRYGADGFNVPHAGFLEPLVPALSPGLYVGLLGIAAVAAFGVVFGAFGRRGVAVAGATFTASWLMSMLDSYQHHYLMSLMFVCLLGMPGGLAGDGSVDDSEHRVKAWGFPLLCVTVAITYGFAAFAKLEPVWLEGTTMHQIAGGTDFWGLQLWQWFGGGEASFWGWLAHGVVVTQIVVALGYLVAPLADRREGVARGIAWVACVAALGFHISAEWLNFQIKWFSYYMVAVALICLGPRAPVVWLSSGLAWLRRRACAPVVEWAGQGERPIFVGLPAALAAGVAVAQVDLPGTGLLAVGVGVGAAVWVFAAMWRGVPTRGVHGALALVASGICMLGVVSSMQVRWDFYRYAGGDQNRRAPGAETRAERVEMLEDAAAYYRKANAYSPPDDDRREKLREVESKLERLRD